MYHVFQWRKESLETSWNSTLNPQLEGRNALNTNFHGRQNQRFFNIFLTDIFSEIAKNCVKVIKTQWEIMNKVRRVCCCCSRCCCCYCCCCLFVAWQSAVKKFLPAPPPHRSNFTFHAKLTEARKVVIKIHTRWKSKKSLLVSESLHLDIILVWRHVWVLYP